MRTGKYTRRAVIVMSLVPLVSTLGIAAADPENASVAGLWKMVSTTPDGTNVDWRLTLKQEEGKWTGTITGDEGTVPVKSLSVTGSKIHFVSPYQGEEYDQDLKLEDGKLAGKWSGNGNDGETKGERVTTP